MLTNYGSFPANTITNFALNGNSSSNTWFRYTNVVQQFASTNSFLTLKIGLNDEAYVGDVTLSASNWNSEVNAATRDGFRVINFLVQGRATQPPGSFAYTYRTNLNAVMKTNPNVWMMIDQEQINSGMADYSNTNYYYDGVHPTALNNSLMASNFNFMLDSRLHQRIKSGLLRVGDIKMAP